MAHDLTIIRCQNKKAFVGRWCTTVKFNTSSRQQAMCVSFRRRSVDEAKVDIAEKYALELNMRIVGQKAVRFFDCGKVKTNRKTPLDLWKCTTFRRISGRRWLRIDLFVEAFDEQIEIFGRRYVDSWRRQQQRRCCCVWWSIASILACYPLDDCEVYNATTSQWQLEQFKMNNKARCAYGVVCQRTVRTQ